MGLVAAVAVAVVRRMGAGFVEVLKVVSTWVVADEVVLTGVEEGGVFPVIEVDVEVTLTWLCVRRGARVGYCAGDNFR